MTGWLPRAALVFLTCIAVAACCEILLRALNFPAADFSPWVHAEATGFAYAPSVHTRFRREGEFDIDFATNSWGLRDDEIGPKTRSRVLLLGDSFASGYGVERGEMFADLLESDLKVDVVNASVGGYELVHQVRYFESHGSLLQPDVVLYALYLANDISRNEEWREGWDGTLVPVGRHPPLRSAGASKLLTLFWNARYRQRLRRDDLREEWEPFPDYLTICERPPSERAQGQWDLAERLLGELQHRVIESGATLVVASFSHRTANDPAARAIYLRRHPARSVSLFLSSISMLPSSCTTPMAASPSTFPGMDTGTLSVIGLPPPH